MQSVETLVIGAGMSGLSFAAALGPGADVVVLEKDSEIGGYCKTVVREGFVWDYSGHFFHFKHPQIEAWLRARMPGQDIRTVAKRSFISYANGRVDFPFQKNIHQLPREEFIDCLHDLYFARAAAGAQAAPETNFKEMLYARFGRSIAEKFLIPYNEKLYATDLSSLDRDAMGRFFPHANVDDIIRNMKYPDNASYNATFTYPAGGAIQYVNAVASVLAPSAMRVGEKVERIDLKSRTAYTSNGEYRFQRLVSSAPFPALLRACGVAVEPGDYSANQVLVFNLGFDRKGPIDLHWLYVPNRERVFYRVGFYDNIFNTDRMSLYVEIGSPQGAQIDIDAMRARVLADLKAEGVVTSHQLIAEHNVVMSPAYVHITQRSIELVKKHRELLAQSGVYSIGRYGGWTYCSIEDNIIEASNLARQLGVAKTPLFAP